MNEGMVFQATTLLCKAKLCTNVVRVLNETVQTYHRCRLFKSIPHLL